MGAVAINITYLLLMTLYKQNSYDKNFIEFKKFFFQSFNTLSPTIDFIPNWHIDILCNMMHEVYRGNIKRLIVCMPPRYMKSLCISTSFPAWVFSQNPSQKIIVASYAMPLAEKLSIDTKSIMESDWYKKNFSNIKIVKNVNSKRKFATTMG